MTLLTERIGVEGERVRRQKEETIAGEQRRTVIATKSGPLSVFLSFFLCSANRPSSRTGEDDHIPAQMDGWMDEVYLCCVNLGLHIKIPRYKSALIRALKRNEPQFGMIILHTRSTFLKRQ